MKKLLLSIFTLLGVVSAFAQTIVSTTPENRNVVLEEFTGIHCVYCPDGHKKANEYAAAHPGDVVLINIHTGSYATPGTGEPDFRTSWGSSIAGQTSLSGYPAGTINRHQFAGLEQNTTTPGTAMNRGNWATAGNQVLAEPSYLNVGATAEIDAGSRTMTVNVEVYYTGNSPQTSNWLNVAIVQNNIEGPQTGGSSFYPAMVLPNGNYLHHHMLRDLITGQWGEEITTTTTGSLYSNTYTYPLPADYTGVEVNIGYIELAVFVTETHQEAVSGIKVEPTYVNFTTQNDARVYGIKLPEYVCGTDVTPMVRIQNLGGTNLTSLSFEASINGGTAVPYTWTGNLSSFQEEEVYLDPVTYTPQATNSVNVTTTSTNGVADENPADNTVTGSFDMAPGSYSTVHFILKTDNYGTETTWEFVNSAGSVLASGGPYTDASLVVEDMDILLPALGCYEFNIYDAYGDGIDAGYGVGFFTVTDSEGTEVISGGNFGSEDLRPFEVTNMTAGISINDFNSGVSVIPNPAKDETFVELSLNSSQNVMFKLYNTQGQLVKSFEEFVNSDYHKTRFDISSIKTGVYFLAIESANSTYTQKLVVE